MRLKHNTLLILATALLLFSCHREESSAVSLVIVTTEVIGPPTPPPPRANVTFIMGSDDWTYNQYYTLATHYYRISTTDRTDMVVEGLTSLSQMLAWLQRHPSPNSIPYGLVNIVSHGNEFIDLQMKVTPGGSRTSPDALRQALLDSLLQTPDSTIADSNTLIFLHGCAVGNNQPLLDGIAQAFGGRATVIASKLFEYYAYLLPNRNPQSLEHYYARTWYAFYHPDSSYSETAIVRQLRRSYPGDTTDWREGLRRRFQDNPSQLYHYSFIVPCTYSEFYENPADMPSVSSQQKRRQWIDSHAELLEMLALTHIPQKYFQFKFYRQKALGDDNQVYHGLRVKARAGVICLIQPLLSSDTTSVYAPLRPSLTDTTFFAFSRY